MGSITPRILIFDSGVGGLSVYDEIHTELPSAEYIYLEDSAVFPYGQLSEPKLVGRVAQVIPSVVDAYRPDVVVIACNSASTISLEPLRELISTPVVGVVPAIKPAAERSQSGTIAVLATSGTVQRSYTAMLIESFAADQEVLLFAADELVVLAETYLATGEINQQSLTDALHALTSHPDYPRVDHVVLGCTHFPLLSEAIAEILHSGIALVDSGSAIARRVRWCLDNEGYSSAAASRSEMPFSKVFHFTGDGLSRPLQAQLKAQRGFTHFEQWLFK